MVKKSKTVKEFLKKFDKQTLSVIEKETEEKKITVVILNNLAFPKVSSKIPKKYHTEFTFLPLSNIWQAFFDNKLDIVKELVSSKIIHDTGLINVIRSSLKLRVGVQERLEQYVTSMVLFGSWARGKAVKGSDIDIAFVIDDTDVRSKTRVEIKKKLRKIILSIAAKISKDFNIQVYLLTQFWEYVRDANPTIFTLLRDGVPIYDRGLFTPWKLLLKMGKIKPTPEAIDSFMSSSKLLLNLVNKTMADLIVEKLYYSMLNPAQAALMFVGISPPIYSDTPKLLKRHFVEKGLLAQKYVNWLDEIIKLRKEIEHSTNRKVSGKLLDKHVNRAEKFSEEISNLFEKLKREDIGEKIKEIDYLFTKGMKQALEMMGFKPPKKNVSSTFVRKVKESKIMPSSYADFVHYLNGLKKDYKKGLVTQQDVNKLEKEAHEFIETITNIIKARELKGTDKFKIKFKYGKSVGEVWFIKGYAYIIRDLSHPEKGVLRAKIKKDGAMGKPVKVTLATLDKKRKDVDVAEEATVKEKTLESIKNMFGSNVEIIISE